MDTMRFRDNFIFVSSQSKYWKPNVFESNNNKASTHDSKNRIGPRGRRYLYWIITDRVICSLHY